MEQLLMSHEWLCHSKCCFPEKHPRSWIGQLGNLSRNQQVRIFVDFLSSARELWKPKAEQEQLFLTAKGWKKEEGGERKTNQLFPRNI